LFADGSEGCGVRWIASFRADQDVRPLADRHYTRQKVGAKQFVAPGRCLVFKTPCLRAVWVTSWPFAQYVKQAWAGAWVNSLFRNEGAGLSSELILEAIAATRAHWPDIPALGLVTFVDAGKVRHKRDPGRCYKKAGFHHVGYTKAGQWAYQLLAAEMPEPFLGFEKAAGLVGLHGQPPLCGRNVAGHY